MRCALFLVFILVSLAAWGRNFTISGHVLDPHGKSVGRAAVKLVPRPRGTPAQTITAENGYFEFHVPSGGQFLIQATADAFEPAEKLLAVNAAKTDINIQFLKLKRQNATVTVTANAEGSTLAAPDPGERVVVRQDMLDANPGRPGAPVSIPGLPIETASGGIKAPQYFVPGVAGDHGEPIAQYIAVGTYRDPNNLSANAHGNGYADPNVLIPQVLEAVEVDGGAFNVLEGNHALNLAATYDLRPVLSPFLTITGDYRDMDVVSGFSPAGPDVRSWIALEVAYGNGLLDRLEHRQQYKINGYRVYDWQNHEVTIFGIGYYGTSFVPGLTPLGVPGLQDTIDPRQKDQTHTAELSVNDRWKLPAGQQLQLSGLFRTYNLSLYSNFGDGLIRQSEFRTVTGGNGTYINKISKYVSLLVGTDYLREAPHPLDLDHYASTHPDSYGPFQRVTANNLTIGDVAPYVALNGGIGSHLRYYAGFRRDEVGINNMDLLNSANSFNTLAGVNSPKATLSYNPGANRWLPNAALSFGEAFFTNDPRIGMGAAQGSLIEKARSYQFVLSKLIGTTDLRMTLGHVTTSANLAKIDPDTGLQENEGPGRLQFLTVTGSHRFRLGLLQASLSKADARDLLSGEPTPEAPRTIMDLLGTLDHLPWRMQVRSELEYVGRKPLGDGFVSIAVKELRGALLRPIAQGRVDVGLAFMIASGYTGQTTEFLALAPDTQPSERVVGVRLPSYVAANVAYHFRANQSP